jgi:hypothetical protein
MLCEKYKHKRQEREDVKTFYGFGNDPMKLYFKHKRKNEG